MIAVVFTIVLQDSWIRICESLQHCQSGLFSDDLSFLIWNSGFLDPCQSMMGDMILCTNQRRLSPIDQSDISFCHMPLHSDSSSCNAFVLNQICPYATWYRVMWCMNHRWTWFTMFCAIRTRDSLLRLGAVQTQSEKSKCESSCLGSSPNLNNGLHWGQSCKRNTGVFPQIWNYIYSDWWLYLLGKVWTKTIIV